MASNIVTEESNGTTTGGTCSNPMASSIKISYNRQIRRVPPNENGSALSLTKLMNEIYNLFPALTEKAFYLTWEDEDGDDVICSTEAEWGDAFQVMRAMGEKTFRFNVKLKETLEAPKPPTSCIFLCSLH